MDITPLIKTIQQTNPNTKPNQKVLLWCNAQPAAPTARRGPARGPRLPTAILPRCPHLHGTRGGGTHGPSQRDTGSDIRSHPPPFTESSHHSPPTRCLPTPSTVRAPLTASRRLSSEAPPRGCCRRRVHRPGEALGRKPSESRRFWDTAHLTILNL